MEDSQLISENTARRLAFIRYLYGVAVDQSQLPEPMCASSVLTFHDAAELFLVLACEKLGVGKKNMEFLAYWEELNRKLRDDSLTQKKAMSRLNEARRGLKHHGNMPARDAIQEYRYIATLFFEENTQTVFGVGFCNISMLYLVDDPAIKTDLEEADRLREQDDLKDAIGKVAVAFHRMLEIVESKQERRNRLLSGLEWAFWPLKPSSYKNRKRSGEERFFEPQKGEGDKDGYAREKIGEILEQTDALKKAVEPMHDAMVALALGLDYGHYRRFLDLTPPVGMGEPMGESYHPSTAIFTPRYHYRRPLYVNLDTYNFCFDFVVETVIRQQASY